MEMYTADLKGPVDNSHLLSIGTVFRQSSTSFRVGIAGIAPLLVVVREPTAFAKEIIFSISVFVNF